MQAISLHLLLAEQWVSIANSITFLIKYKELPSDYVGLPELSHDLRILRVQIEKHEIAKGALTKAGPIELGIQGSEEVELYDASSKDRKHAFIGQSGVSGRHSLMWYVIDADAKAGRWLERRDLSDRFLNVWATR
jgi:hypothetical protein